MIEVSPIQAKAWRNIAGAINGFHRHGCANNGEYNESQAVTHMAITHIEMTQRILDRNHQKLNAKELLTDWGIDLLRNERPDVMILPAMLYDAFGQESLSRPRSSPMIELKDPTFLLTEVIYRYLKDALGPNFIEQSSKLFDQASKFRALHDSVSRDMQSIARNRSFQALHRSSEQLVQETDDLVRQVYLMGETKRILKGLGSRKIRPLYEKDEVSLGLGRKFTMKDRPSIPAFETIKNRINAAHEAVDLMSNRELCIRTLKSLAATDMAKREVDRPLYGTKTVFAYAPIIIGRLLNGCDIDNAPVMTDLSEKMTLATEQLKAIKHRLERVTASPELS